MNKKSPTFYPLKLLRWFCKEELIDEIEGDLIEAYWDRFQRNPLSARWKLWKEVLQSFNARNMDVSKNFRDYKWAQNWGLFMQYARVLVRTIRRSKIYSTISIVSLVMGIVCASLIFIYIQKELSYDQIYTDYDQIFRINSKSETSGRSYGFAPLALTPYLVENLDAVEKGTRIFKYRRAIPVTVESSRSSFNEPKFGWVDENFFELFDLEMVIGDPKAVLRKPNSVVINESIASKYFGDQDPIGKQLEFNWSASNQLEIVGVYKDFPTNTSFQLDLISNLETCQRFMWSSNLLVSWQNMFVSAYIKVKPDRLREVEAFAQEAVTENFESSSVWSTWLQPLTDIHMGVPMDIGEWNEHNDISTLVLFGSIGAIILCLGCFNFMNMITAQAGQRSKEVGVRKVLGSQRRQIAQQTYFETISFVLFAGVCSLLLIYLLLPSLGTLTNHGYGLPDLINPSFLGPYLLILFGVALLSGSYPAVYMAKITSMQLMKKISSSDDGRWMREVLVTSQFTITTGLVICSLVVFNQLRFMHNKQLGYDHSILVNMPIHNDDAIIPKIGAFRNEVTSQPGVSNITASSHEMLSDYTYITNFNIEGIDEPKLWERYTVEQGFISTFDLEMVSGRPFDPSIKSDSSAFILNERAVANLGLLPGEIIGRTITDETLDKTGKVIGVVKDFHFRSLHHEIQPFVMYVNWDRLDYITARLGSRNFVENIEHLEASWYRSFGDEVPFFYEFLDQQAAHLYEREQNEMQLFSIFCVLSILLGSLGLFGFVLFTTERKFNEIGLRKVLGASTSEIMLLINRSFVKMLVYSFLIATPLAYWLMNTWLNDFAYHIDQPIWVYMVTLSVTFTIAIMTVSYSSWRAASSNPIEAIKSE